MNDLILQETIEHALVDLHCIEHNLTDGHPAAGLECVRHTADTLRDALFRLKAERHLVRRYSHREFWRFVNFLRTAWEEDPGDGGADGPLLWRVGYEHDPDPEDPRVMIEEATCWFLTEGRKHPPTFALVRDGLANSGILVVGTHRIRAFTVLTEDCPPPDALVYTEMDLTIPQVDAEEEPFLPEPGLEPEPEASEDART